MTLAKLLTTALIAASVASAMAQTYDKTWTPEPPGLDLRWSNPLNWAPVEEVPQPGETVFIENSYVFISEEDAECKSITMVDSVLTIDDLTLTLGDDNAETTTTLADSEIRLFGSESPARIVVRNWVRFAGVDDDLNPDTPRMTAFGSVFVERAGGDAPGIGMRTDGDMDVEGDFWLQVSVDHQGDFFGADKTTMIFGTDTDVDPDYVISGASLNAAAFTAASYGRIEFHQMQFASTAPKWIADGLFDEPNPYTASIYAKGQKNNVPNDIELEQYSRLEIEYDQTFNGKLWMKAKDTKIVVSDGTTATFEAP